MPCHAHGFIIVIPVRERVCGGGGEGEHDCIVGDDVCVCVVRLQYIGQRSPHKIRLKIAKSVACIWIFLAV